MTTLDKGLSYAAWRISFQSSEQAAQAAYKMYQLEAAKYQARIAELESRLQKLRDHIEAGIKFDNELAKSTPQFDDEAFDIVYKD